MPAKTTAKELDIEVIWNAAYRPDLNGIEFYWAKLKAEWRAEMTAIRVADADWDQETLMKRLVHGVRTVVTQGFAKKGWSNLMKAVVIPALRNLP